jgi:hypothetical protein
METVSIITGKVRDVSKAKRVAESLISMRTRGYVDSIVFSTWIGELDQYPELSTYLNKNDISVIETNNQRWSLQESHQKIPLLTALNFLGKETYVTRHRFDRILPDSVFEKHMAKVKENGITGIEDPFSPGSPHQIC